MHATVWTALAHPHCVSKDVRPFSAHVLVAHSGDIWKCVPRARDVFGKHPSHHLYDRTVRSAVGASAHRGDH